LTAFGLYQIFLLKKSWMKYVLIGIGIFAVVEFGYYLNYYYVNYPKEALIDWGGSCKQVTHDMQKMYKNYQHIVVDKTIDCAPEYFEFYIPQVPITIVTSSWFRPESWKGQSILYVRPYYGNPKAEGVVDTVYLPNINHDIFSQFYSL
jgi:hypothetical protein